MSFAGHANKGIFELVGSVDEMPFKDDDGKFELVARALSGNTLRWFQYRRKDFGGQ